MIFARTLSPCFVLEHVLFTSQSCQEVYGIGVPRHSYYYFQILLLFSKWERKTFVESSMVGLLVRRLTHYPTTQATQQFNIQATLNALWRKYIGLRTCMVVNNIRILASQPRYASSISTNLVGLDKGMCTHILQDRPLIVDAVYPCVYDTLRLDFLRTTERPGLHWIESWSQVYFQIERGACKVPYA